MYLRHCWSGIFGFVNQSVLTAVSSVNGEQEFQISHLTFNFWDLAIFRDLLWLLLTASGACNNAVSICSSLVYNNSKEVLQHLPSLFDIAYFSAQCKKLICLISHKKNLTFFKREIFLQIFTLRRSDCSIFDRSPGSRCQL